MVLPAAKQLPLPDFCGPLDKDKDSRKLQKPESESISSSFPHPHLPTTDSVSSPTTAASLPNLHVGKLAHFP